jgi:hypothetical protein
MILLDLPSANVFSAAAARRFREGWQLVPSTSLKVAREWRLLFEGTISVQGE